VNERQFGPERMWSKSRPVILVSGEKQQKAVLFDQPGEFNLADQVGCGLRPQGRGQTLIVTQAGLFLVRRSFVYEVPASPKERVSVAHIPRALQSSLRLIIGKGSTTIGLLCLPQIESVLVDQRVAVDPNEPGERMPNPFVEVEAALKESLDYMDNAAARAHLLPSSNEDDGSPTRPTLEAAINEEFL
jgi:hypothetical protein